MQTTLKNSMWASLATLALLSLPAHARADTLPMAAHDPAAATAGQSNSNDDASVPASDAPPARTARDGSGGPSLEPDAGSEASAWPGSETMAITSSGLLLLGLLARKRQPRPVPALVPMNAALETEIDPAPEPGIKPTIEPVRKSAVATPSRWPSTADSA